jgi:hypothetical protein
MKLSPRLQRDVAMRDVKSLGRILPVSWCWGSTRVMGADTRHGGAQWLTSNVLNMVDDTTGDTILHRAVRTSSPQVVALLLSYVDVTIENRGGQTAAKLARSAAMRRVFIK